MARMYEPIDVVVSQTLDDRLEIVCEAKEVKEKIQQFFESMNLAQESGISLALRNQIDDLAMDLLMTGLAVAWRDGFQMFSSPARRVRVHLEEA